ncbi:succinate-semialdehyde dehydrogenase / glutarate-semialdehyde dehydrogenase [Tessaracoccus bendigoensis DSM 12906]|uniref:Succinate-semialdehyde dehydrogenase / glutarate-semialdehyde dehydrogenase n=1 Tax=Tessaracoccus bendigoensis DSM 12906 TaxID=1123357 RepID=A0A1M6MTD2_9ACTN|nr:NAD-dependent succinate-semialdehyde dehydrogenase [Tessaracoccus bendigoensis]SHJ86523.1 succinate-semialdehyde dehydrogenase / glutarate-semialdehyde dehydrogenase [Tessaracoccus bendigoensis DSM 12906]
MTVNEVLARVPVGQFIAGEFVATGSTFKVFNPATGELLTEVSDASPEHAQAAFDATCEAADGWAATDPRKRAEILRRAFELIVERGDDFATLMTLEMGKPLAEARGEVAYGAEFFRWFSEEACRIEGRWSTAPLGGNRLLTMKQPVGPVYAITPWNFPLAMGTRKIGPALAAGCTVVAKPASLTPLTMLYLMQTLKDAGVPDGVVNCVVSSRSSVVSKPILEDPRLRKLTFTGSTEVGRTLLKQAADGVLRTSMELGGNAPFVVLSDADVDGAVAGAIPAKFRNNGEACTAANRFYVHRDLVDEFASKLVAAVGQLVVGDGMDPATTLGPLIDDDAVAKVTELVDDAIAKGAKVLTGGAAMDGPGHFFQPTVLADVPRDARLLREEIFGPVAPIVTVDDDDEAIALANDTEFGLMAYVYSRDIGRVLGAAERLESGIVAVNTGVVSNPAAPFGGVKQSGLGREGSHEGLDEYLETKYLGLAL